jgi:hypothetical protein
VCLALDEVAAHVMTTRAWRLGARSADDSADAWADVAQAMKVDPTALLRVHQIHGSAVAVRRGGQKAGRPDQPDADISVSNDPAAAVAVQSADCVPILIAARRTGCVAAAHAGWRGLAAGVATAVVGAMVREFDSDPHDLVAAIGPSIGPCCYEVGADVRDRFRATNVSATAIARWFHGRPQPTTANPSMPGLPSSPRPAHWYFDPWAATRDGLEAAGMLPDQIHVAMLCTASHADVFCSHRRDGPPAGRMAAAIRCPPLRP